MEMHDASAKVLFVRVWHGFHSWNCQTETILSVLLCLYNILSYIHTRENVRSSCFLPQQGQRDTGMRLLAKSIHGTRENR